MFSTILSPISDCHSTKTVFSFQEKRTRFSLGFFHTGRHLEFTNTCAKVDIRCSSSQPQPHYQDLLYVRNKMLLFSVFTTFLNVDEWCFTVLEQKTAKVLVTVPRIGYLGRASYRHRSTAVKFFSSVKTGHWMLPRWPSFRCGLLKGWCKGVSRQCFPDIPNFPSILVCFYQKLYPR